jgi:hypothetical protein
MLERVFARSFYWKLNDATNIEILSYESILNS